MLKNYKKSDYQTKLDIEIKHIKEAQITECAKNNSLVLSEVKKDTVKIVTKTEDNTAELKPTKENLIGNWKDDEDKSEFSLNQNGSLLVETDGKTSSGTWKSR